MGVHLGVRSRAERLRGGQVRGALVPHVHERTWSHKQHKEQGPQVGSLRHMEVKALG